MALSVVIKKTILSVTTTMLAIEPQLKNYAWDPQNRYFLNTLLRDQDLFYSINIHLPKLN
jgi:hypothetical protein